MLDSTHESTKNPRKDSFGGMAVMTFNAMRGGRVMREEGRRGRQIEVRRCRRIRPPDHSHPERPLNIRAERDIFGLSLFER